MYCDTSLIIEALENRFSEGYPSLYPSATDGRDYRPLARGFVSYWTDLPIYRVVVGLMPASVWRSKFGRDRENLVGHKIDAERLGAKVPMFKSKLDMHFSMLEPLFQPKSDWIFNTKEPSLADIALYEHLAWGDDLASGRGLYNLSGGELQNTNAEGIDFALNERRYPGLTSWFKRFRSLIDNLPLTETKPSDTADILENIQQLEEPVDAPNLLPTPAPSFSELDEHNGLRLGSLVTVYPDIMGKDSPIVGTLVALGPEEIVLRPDQLESPARISVNAHFPRLGFEIKSGTGSKL